MSETKQMVARLSIEDADIITMLARYHRLSKEKVLSKIIKSYLDAHKAEADRIRDEMEAEENAEWAWDAK